MKLPVYLDYNATTPVDPAVVEAMMPYLLTEFGNPSSSHAYGLRANAAVNTARGQVAALLGAHPDELIFTSCASESINQAIKGAAFARRHLGNHLITSAVEHPATLNACHYLANAFGFQLTVLPVGPDGRVDPEQVRQAIRPTTLLISIMHAQNETGTLQPIRAIGQIAREHAVLLHVDAAQSVGKLPVHVDDLVCDMLTVAGHKLYAPKGVGALYVRRGVTLDPLIHGASYEGGRRAGTANVPYVVALGEACRLAGEKLAAGEPERQAQLRDRLHGLLATQVPGLRLNGHPHHRLPNTRHLCLPGVVGNDLLALVPTVAASTGSACHEGVNSPSEVLLAMGVAPDLALGALRLSLGRYTTTAEIDYAAQQLLEVLVSA
jgi:cysteine desulfurase